MIKRCLWLISIAALVAVGGASARQTDKKNVSLKQEQNFKGYVVRIYENQSEGAEQPEYFEVLRNGRLIYSREGWELFIGSRYEDKWSRLISMGKDVTGRGIPNLVVSEWSGGAHCCLTYYVFEIGEEFRFIADVQDGGAQRTGFRNLDGDKNLEFVDNDDSFNYWRSSFAESPSPKVVLRFQNGGYRFAEDLMRKPAPSFRKLSRRAKLIQKNEQWENNFTPHVLWHYMLELIYSGNSDSAWKFFDMAWPSDIEGKEEFLEDFCTQLSHSGYCSSIKDLNRGDGRLKCESRENEGEIEEE